MSSPHDVPTVTDLPTGAFLLDVREDDEWIAGHAPDATHVPLAQLPQALGVIPRDRQVVAVCRSGGRSGRATTLLREQGYDAHNYAGGMQAWDAAGHPMVAESGATPEVI